MLQGRCVGSLRVEKETGAEGKGGGGNAKGGDLKAKLAANEV